MTLCSVFRLKLSAFSTFSFFLNIKFLIKTLSEVTYFKTDSGIQVVLESKSKKKAIVFINN